MIVPQNAAVRVLPTTGQRCCSDIVVDAPLDQVRPARLLAPAALGPPFAELVADSPAFAFIIPAVRFCVLGETWSLAPLSES